jgi:hypothetical protein
MCVCQGALIQIGAPEIGPFQIRSLQVGSLERSLLQICQTQISATIVLVVSSFEPLSMRLEDRAERFGRHGFVSVCTRARGIAQGRRSWNFRQTEAGCRHEHTQHKDLVGKVTVYRGILARHTPHHTHCVVLHGVATGLVQRAKHSVQPRVVSGGTTTCSGGKVAEERSRINSSWGEIVSMGICREGGAR